MAPYHLATFSRNSLAFSLDVIFAGPRTFMCRSQRAMIVCATCSGVGCMSNTSPTFDSSILSRAPNPRSSPVWSLNHRVATHLQKQS